MMFFRSKNKIQRKTLQEKEVQGQKVNLSRALFYFLLAAFAGVLAYVLLFSPYLEISHVYIQGIEELDHASVRQAAGSFLDEKYFRTLSKKNLLLAGAGELEGRLQDDFKKISSAEVKKIFPDTLVILITERKSLLVWCSGERCFLVDEKGLAYAPAEFDSPEIKENNLVIVHDQSLSDIPGDRPAFNPAFGNFLIEFRQRAEDGLGIRMSSDFETPKSISGDLTGVTEEGWRINLNAEIGVEKELGMLGIVLEKNIAPEKRKELEYVDLRTEGKVYYKFKNVAPEETAEGKKE